MTHPTVIIAEDSVLIQEAMRLLLQKDFDIAATADDGEAAVQQVLAVHPDILLLDLSLPLLNGFEVVERLQAANTSVKIIFVSAYSDSVLVERAFELGAGGYVLKSTMHSELGAAMRAVLDGGTFRSAPIRTLAEKRARPRAETIK